MKVRDDRVAHYESLGPDYEGPIPYVDLYRDALGYPIEGITERAARSDGTQGVHHHRAEVVRHLLSLGP